MRSGSQGVSTRLNVIVAVLASLMLVDGAAAQGPDQSVTNGVNLRIEMARATVSGNDPITVRLTLVNQSPKKQVIASAPPTALAALHVYDDAGNEIKPTLPVATPIWSGRPLTVAAGAELVLRWAGREWLELRDWGFDLRAPGNYKISGDPVVGSVKMAQVAGKPNSNIAELRIER